MSSLFQWAVIGAGPAGIAAVGKLLDAGIDPKQIAWIDPKFQVGDFGTKWRFVSSNTRVGLFNDFLNACRSFHYAQAPDFALRQLNPGETCLLGIAAEPLAWVTAALMQQVACIHGKVEALELRERRWHIQLPDEKTLQAKNVVLALGAIPKTMQHPGVESIPLDVALDPHQLKAACGADDVIAVFGSSHSAIIILQTLLEQCDVKQVVNFYRAPLRYALYLENQILFDDSGLKGKTAEWARNHIDGTLPPKLQRDLSNDQNLQAFLPACTKAIYAVGFERRPLPVKGYGHLSHHPAYGILAPGLFGLGIAFPESRLIGTETEYRVGLWKFMDYLERVMPIWLKYGT